MVALAEYFKLARVRHWCGKMPARFAQRTTTHFVTAVLLDNEHRNECGDEQ